MTITLTKLDQQIVIRSAGRVIMGTPLSTQMWSTKEGYIVRQISNQILITIGPRSIWLYPTSLLNMWNSPENIAPTPPARMVWPFNPALIFKEWGYRPPPLPGLSNFHSGVDWNSSAGAGAGKPIPCAGDGTVSMVVRKGVAGAPGGASWGNRVLVDHGVKSDGHHLYTAYAHMRDANFPYVSPGQNVSAGETLGFVGTTGSSTGNHLHFVCFIDGIVVGNLTNPRNCANPRTFMATYNPAGTIA
jgi:murein DD-endopeptidase MepM/ murein hydrolase activator NlpD